MGTAVAFGMVGVTVFGLGPIGVESVKLAASKKWLFCVGAVDIDPAKVGKSVGEILKQARLGKAVDVAQTVPVIEDISSSMDRNASALVSFVRLKAADEYTYLHSVAVCALMINLGRQLLFDESEISELATEFGLTEVQAL